MSVRAFLSYSHKDKKLAHQVKKGLEGFGVGAFLAHDDISVSTLWRKEILKNLRSCDVFVPIMTKAFAESEWTDQEVGYALGRGKVIVPLKVDKDPYGLIGVYQALRLKRESVRDAEIVPGLVESGGSRVCAPYATCSC